MKEWFLTVGGNPFPAFGTSHVIMLLIYFVLAILLLYFQSDIRSNKKAYQRIRWILFTLLIVCEVSYQSWTATHGIWLYNLPFHLCGVAGIVGALALWTLNRSLIAISFFIGLIPALFALITPDLLYDFPNFRFFKFFIHHIAISLTSLFLAIISTEGTITANGMLKTYAYLVIYALFTGFIINPWLNANYLFLAHPPEISSPLDWFGSGLLYYLNLGIVCFIVFTLQYFLYRFFIKYRTN